MKIIPTVFAHNKKEFNKRFAKLVKNSKDIQIDFMDENFVKAKSVKLDNIPNLKKYKNNFEAHLMTKNPEKWLSELRKKGFKKILFHFEAFDNENKVKKLVHEIKAIGLIPGVVFNPDTSFRYIFNARKYAGLIMFMGHVPGVEHKNLEKNVLEKIKALRRIDKNIKIQVDGGVNDKTIKKLKKAGVDFVNVGSFVGNAQNPGEVLKDLKKKL